MDLSNAPLFALNLAIASVVCLALSHSISRFFRSLPKRYGVELVGLVAIIIAPPVILVGTNYSLGIFSVSDSFSEAELPFDRGPVAMHPGTVTHRDDHPLPSMQETPNPIHSASVPVDFSADTRESTSADGTPSHPHESPRHTVASHTTIPPVTSPPSVLSSTIDWLSRLGLFLAVIWPIGCFVALLGLARKLRSCRQFLSNCRPITDKQLLHSFGRQCHHSSVVESVELLESDRVAAPLTLLWFSTKIVLPRDIQSSLSKQALREVLAHELAHVRRRDHWVAFLQELASVVYWWNPMVQRLSRSLNELRELICDDIAVSQLCKEDSHSGAVRYAETLIRLAEKSVSGRCSLVSVGIGSSPSSEMERRIQRILSERSQRDELSISKKFQLMLVASTLLISFALLFAQIPLAQAQNSDEDKSQPSRKATQVEGNESRSIIENGDHRRHTLSGTVRNADGSVSVGAAVRVDSVFVVGDVSAATDEQGRFRIRVQIPPFIAYPLRLTARSADGSQIRFLTVSQNDDQTEFDHLEFKLQPTATEQIKVVDGKGNGLANANVAIGLSGPAIAGPLTTNSDGIAEFAYPNSASIVSVVAWQDGSGLDYRLYSLSREHVRDQFTEKPTFPSEGMETLTLGGARPIAVHVTDPEGHPVVGARTATWYLRKASEFDELNLGRFADCFASYTGADGRVSWNWIPTWQDEFITVWAEAKGFIRSRELLFPANMSAPIAITLQRLVPIRGRVAFPDGSPAANIAVNAFGIDYTQNHWHGTTTDESGRYELRAAPNMNYMVYVEDNKWAAPAQSGFVIYAGDDVPDHDFQLSRATRVFGHVLNRETGEPVPGQVVTLSHFGTELREIGDNLLPNPDHSMRRVRPVAQRSARVGADGTFEFFVGDGEYKLFINFQDSKDLSIQGQQEMEADLRVEVVPETLLTGLVVDEETGNPLSGANVEAVSLSYRPTDQLQATTNSVGKFQVTRNQDPYYLFATNAERTMGGVAKVPADETEAQIKLTKFGKAKGRLTTSDGTEPARRVKLHYGYRIYHEGNKSSSLRFGKIIETDDNGMFVLPELVAGGDYQCNMYETRGGYVCHIAEMKVKAGESIDLGDLTCSVTTKENKPPQHVSGNR